VRAGRINTGVIAWANIEWANYTGIKNPRIAICLEYRSRMSCADFLKEQTVGRFKKQERRLQQRLLKYVVGKPNDMVMSVLIAMLMSGALCKLFGDPPEASEASADQAREAARFLSQWFANMAADAPTPTLQ
jgi:hypothetical protein